MIQWKTLNRRVQWFTFVELIVVVTILAILATVWFTSYNSYIGWSRDANRIATLENIRSGLATNLLSSTSGLQLPTNHVEIKFGTKTIGYQWYVGDNILESIGLEKWGKDPDDGSFYTYYLWASWNKFQLLGFLEDQQSLQASTKITPESKAVDYANSFPTVTGEKLWVLIGTWSDKNVPLQEITDVKALWLLDVETTGTEYSAVVSEDNIITWDSSKLTILNSLEKTWGRIGKSCKDLLDSDSSLLGQDWVYYIEPNDSTSLEVYCDMSFDKGGWTFVYFQDGNLNASEPFFEKFVWNYSLSRQDTNDNYSIPTNIFSHTEMVVTLEEPSLSIADKNKDIVFYKYEEWHMWFNSWPILCQWLTNFSYKYSFNDTYESWWMNNSCWAVAWYSRDNQNLQLILLHKTSWSRKWAFRWNSLETSSATPETSDGWWKNAWFYIR